MQNEILVPIANGTEEMEVVIIVDILRRAGLNVVLAGEFSELTCSRNVKIVADKLLTDLIDEEFMAIIIPGGLLGVENLTKSNSLKQIINNNNNATIGAICAAPLVLQNFNLLNENSIITSHPSVESKLSDSKYSTDRVVIDGKIITSRSAGTAFEFAFELVKIFSDENTANRIKNDILFK